VVSISYFQLCLYNTFRIFSLNRLIYKGMPTSYDKPLICLNCTMCCNMHSECHETEHRTAIKSQPTYWTNMTWIMLLSIAAVLSLAAFACYTFNKRHKTFTRSFSVRSVIVEEKALAWETIGESDSLMHMRH
jgi:hypothetical protein